MGCHAIAIARKGPVASHPNNLPPTSKGSLQVWQVAALVTHVVLYRNLPVTAGDLLPSLGEGEPRCLGTRAGMAKDG